MDRIWMEAVLTVTVVCIVSSAALIVVWRKRNLYKLEKALIQLQNELARLNTLLEQTRSRIIGAATESEASAPSQAISETQPRPGESESPHT